MTQDQVSQVLSDPIAQDLLYSDIPARLAYTGLDGFPRVIPVGFLCTGTHFIIGTAANSPKMKALKANPHVALTIDINTFPPVPATLHIRSKFRVESAEI